MTFAKQVISQSIRADTMTKSRTLLIFSFFLLISDVFTLSDVTDKVFSKVPSGIMAAFGDFNADKYTDVFLISGDGESFQESVITAPAYFDPNTLRPRILRFEKKVGMICS